MTIPFHALPQLIGQPEGRLFQTTNNNGHLEPVEPLDRVTVGYLAHPLMNDGRVWDSFLYPRPVRRWQSQSCDTYSALTTVGCSLPPDESAASKVVYRGQFGPFTRYQTSGSVDEVASVADADPASGGEVVLPDWLPFLEWIIHPTQGGPSASDVRLWFGLFEGDPSTSDDPDFALAAIRYDTNVDSGGVWTACCKQATGVPMRTRRLVEFPAIQNLPVRVMMFVQPARVWFRIAEGDDRFVAPPVMHNAGPQSLKVLSARATATALTASSKGFDLSRMQLSIL